MRAFIGLGTNIGDRLANLRRAIEELGASVKAVSPVYETDPIGPAQPDFLNAVAEIWTDLDPLELLAWCKQIESQIGREAGERWGPRIIDLDLLLYGDRALDEPPLHVPHKQMHVRAFVLVPLHDLDPELMVPGHGAVHDLLAKAGSDGVRLCGSL